MHLDLDKIKDNPLTFWKQYGKAFPLLSSVARRLHLILASAASVARTFSGGGQVVTERRTDLSSSQVGNVLFMRSVVSNGYFSLNYFF